MVLVKIYAHYMIQSANRFAWGFIENLFLLSSLYRILGLGVPGAMVPLGSGTFFIGESKNFAFFQARTFSKNVKKNQWKFYNCLKVLREFSDFLKILQKFSRKFKEKFRELWKYGFVGGSGGGAHRS